MSREDQNYWDIVRAQFRKQRTAVWGLRVLGVLLAIAIAAPLLATSTPFAIRDAGGWRFPWFGELLDQTRWEGAVDLFFNLLLIFLVPLLPAALFWKRARRALVGWGSGLFLYSFFCVAGPDAIVESTAGKVVFSPQEFLRYRRPPVDWRDVRAAYFERVLAEQRAAEWRTKVESAPDEGAREKSEAQLALWEGRLEAARAAEAKADVIAILPPIGFHHDDNDEDRIVEGPTSGWGIGHWLGTDTNGRDVLARLIYGARISMTIGVIAVAIYCTIGTILGALMGFFGGWVDMLLMRLVEIMICFPTLAFLLVIVGTLKTKSIFVMMVAIGLVGWTGVARLIRGQCLSERNLDYVLAAKALGVPQRRIMFKHVLPNAIHPMFVSATFGIAAAILVESSLAFLGLGDPNVPSWGQILLEGRTTMKNTLIMGPGFAIFLTVTLLNLVGEGLRDALDPKLRQ